MFSQNIMRHKLLTLTYKKLELLEDDERDPHRSLFYSRVEVSNATIMVNHITISVSIST